MSAASLTDILALEDVPSGSGATVGGKAAQLADLARAGFPVPAGIVVTAGAKRPASVATYFGYRSSAER